MIDEEILNNYSFPTPNGGLLLSTEIFQNGNMVRSTAELLFLINEVTLINRELYIIGLCECEPELKSNPGIFSRYPNKIQNTQVDDYLAAGCRSDLAIDILKSVRKNYGFANLESKKSFSSFIYRFQGMWQHLRISAGETPGFLGQLLWSIAIISAANKPFSYQDSWCLSHLMILTKQRRNFSTRLTDLAERYWYYKKGNKTTSSIMADYVGPNCQDHPLISAWEPYN